jgi:hypothetical protein
MTGDTLLAHVVKHVLNPKERWAQILPAAYGAALPDPLHGGVITHLQTSISLDHLIKAVTLPTLGAGTPIEALEHVSRIARSGPTPDDSPAFVRLAREHMTVLGQLDKHVTVREFVGENLGRRDEMRRRAREHLGSFAASLSHSYCEAGFLAIQEAALKPRHCLYRRGKSLLVHGYVDERGIAVAVGRDDENVYTIYRPHRGANSSEKALAAKCRDLVRGASLPARAAERFARSIDDMLDRYSAENWGADS